MNREQMIAWLIAYNRKNSYFGEENELEYIQALYNSTDEELAEDIESKKE